MADTYLILTYTTIFSAKFSLLFFFHTLTRRIRQMTVYWWTVLFIMTVGWIFTIVAIICICPDFGIDSCTMMPVLFLLDIEH